MNKEILCLIYNHNHNENCKLWLDRLVKAGFDTYILDSGSDEPLNDKRVIKFDNIYWGGLYSESVKLVKEKNYKWLFVVCDDILIDEDNFNKLLKSMDEAIKSDNIGIYQPSTTSDSHNVWRNNINRNSGGLRNTGNIEGWMFLIREDILDEMKSYGVDFAIDMKTGWGVDILLSYTSMRMGYKNVVDDRVIVVHPMGEAGYDGNEAQKQMNNTFDKIGKDYNYLVSRCNSMKRKNDGSNGIKLVCCLLNYKHDSNSNRWFDILSPYFDTYIIDIFHKDDNSKFEGDVPQNKIVYLNNVYWGGSYIEAYKVLCREKGDYLLTVDTDIEIDDNNANKMIKALDIFNYYDNIGVYTGTLKLGSKALGSTQVTIGNCHLYNHGTGKLRAVHAIEGWLNIVKKELMDDIFPYLNLSDNKYGWGILPAVIRRAIKRNFRVVADDRYEVFHPVGIIHSNIDAKEEEDRFKRRYWELDCILEEEKQEFLDNLKK